MPKYHQNAETFGDLAPYGSDAPEVERLIRSEPGYGDRIHDDFAERVGEIVWAVRSEMARTVDDVLARRTRCLIFNARAAIEAAPKVAAVMAETLGRDRAWADEQIETFSAMASGYVLAAPTRSG